MFPRFAFFLLAVCLLAVVASAQNAPPTIAVSDPATPILNQINDVSCISYSLILYCSAGIAALLIMLAGFEYMSSEGDAVKRDRAKTRVIYAVAGLILVILACPFVDYLVMNTKILPFQRACDCMAGHVKATTTTTQIISTTTTTTFVGGITTSSTTTTLAATGGKVVFDSSMTRFLYFSSGTTTSGPGTADNSKYISNIASWLDTGNKKILIYMSDHDTAAVPESKLVPLLNSLGYSTDVRYRSGEDITSSLLSGYGQVWFIDNSILDISPQISQAEKNAVLNYYQNNGRIVLTGETGCDSSGPGPLRFMVGNIAPVFNVAMTDCLDTTSVELANNLVKPVFTSHPVVSGLVTVSNTGSDLKIVSNNPNTIVVATVLSQPYILVLDKDGGGGTTTTTGGSTTSTSGGSSTTSTSTSSTSQSTTSSSTTTTTLAFKMTILFVPVDWDQGMPAFNSLADDQTAILLKYIPLKACPSKLKTIKLSQNCVLNVPSDFNSCYADNGRILTGIEDCAKNSGEKYDYIAGFSTTQKCGHRGFSSSTSPVIYLAGPTGVALTHELGHQWKLDDEYYDACRCWQYANKLNCLDASIGGSDPGTGYTSSYCAGGNLCPTNFDTSCLGNKNPGSARCIMGDFFVNPAGSDGFCVHCMNQLNTLNFLKC